MDAVHDQGIASTIQSSAVIALCNKTCHCIQYCTGWGTINHFTNAYCWGLGENCSCHNVTARCTQYINLHDNQWYHIRNGIGSLRSPLMISCQHACLISWLRSNTLTGRKEAHIILSNPVTLSHSPTCCYFDNILCSTLRKYTSKWHNFRFSACFGLWATIHASYVV